MFVYMYTFVALFCIEKLRIGAEIEKVAKRSSAVSKSNKTLFIIIAELVNSRWTGLGEVEIDTYACRTKEFWVEQESSTSAKLGLLYGCFGPVARHL